MLDQNTKNTPPKFPAKRLNFSTSQPGKEWQRPVFGPVWAEGNCKQGCVCHIPSLDYSWFYTSPQCSVEKIALYMQCMHCLCSTKLYIYFLLWWCIVMYAILGFTIWSHIEGDPYPRNSPSDGAFLSYLSYSKSPSQPGQKFGIVFLAIHTTYFVLCMPCMEYFSVEMQHCSCDWVIKVGINVRNHEPIKKRQL